MSSSSSPGFLGVLSLCVASSDSLLVSVAFWLAVASAVFSKSLASARSNDFCSSLDASGEGNGPKVKSNSAKRSSTRL